MGSTPSIIKDPAVAPIAFDKKKRPLTYSGSTELFWRSSGLPLPPGL